MQPDYTQLTNQDPVKAYLAHWFQLGKKLLFKSGQPGICPGSVLVPGGYSSEFEALWQRIISGQAGDCYLDGTHETIAQLRQHHWEIIHCARCEMPIALPQNGLSPFNCPCAGLENWPNLDLPCPRCPADTQAQLSELQSRLKHQFEEPIPGDHDCLAPP